MAESIEAMDQAVKAITIQTGKYLTFFLENEEYGIGILKIKEIIGKRKSILFRIEGKN